MMLMPSPGFSHWTVQAVPQDKNWGRTATVVVSPGKRMQQRVLSYLHVLLKSMTISKERMTFQVTWMRRKPQYKLCIVQFSIQKNRSVSFCTLTDYIIWLLLFNAVPCSISPLKTLMQFDCLNYLNYIFTTKSDCWQQCNFNPDPIIKTTFRL